MFFSPGFIILYRRLHTFLHTFFVFVNIFLPLLVYALFRWVFLNEKWAILSAMLCRSPVWYFWHKIYSVLYYYSRPTYCHGLSLITHEVAVYRNTLFRNIEPLPCDRLNYHPLPCDRLNWHTFLNQWEDRKFTSSIINANVCQLVIIFSMWSYLPIFNNVCQYVMMFVSMY